MTTIVTFQGRTMATYNEPIPAEWVNGMKKAGYKVKTKEAKENVS